MIIMIKNFTAYLEQLCRKHEKLRHSDEERHFVNLNEDSQNTSLAEELHYPAVFFETTGYRISGGSIDEMKKTYTCHIEVFTHVSDTGDYVEVESALSETERIIDDIFAKINLDKYRRTPKWLQGMSFDGIDVVPLQNEKNALYGWMAEVMLQTPYCITDNNVFTIEDNG